MLQGQVVQLQQQNGDLTGRVSKLEAERQSGNAELTNLKEQLEARLSDADKEQKRKEKLDKELKELRQAMEARQSEINAKKEDTNRIGETITQMENQLRHEKQTTENLNNRHEMLEHQKESLRKGQKEEELTHVKTKEENEDLKGQLERRQDEINDLTSLKNKFSKQHDILRKKQISGQAETKKLEESRNFLKGEIKGLVEEMERLKKQAELENKQIVDLLHERDILNKNVMKADDKTKAQVDLVKRHEGQANTLAKDLQRWKTELQLKLFRIHELDKLREKYASELGIAKTRYEIACEELKNRDNHMAQLKKSITDLKARLSQQKNLYEAVRTDKNLYSKNLTEATEEIGEMVKKFKVMHHQIEQLKEEIKEKDKQLITEHFDHQFISKESDKTKENLERHSKQQKRLQQVVDLQQQEIKKLEATISEAEVERQNQRKEFEGVISERNILGTQLIRRNEELALLYEKIKIQESTLKKGETQYRHRLEEIKKQKDSIGAHKYDLAVNSQQSENIEDHKKEVYHLQRELLQERTKVKALSEELENPMNVHRWRKLEGSDPAMYELIQKVRTLQKRLIKKTEEVVAKDHEIQEKERLHRELTGILEKQPGPEVMEQLEMFQDNLAAKLNQMKAMQSELKTYQDQVSDYKDEIDRLTRELQEVKKKFFEQKKREQIQTETQRGDTKAIHPKPQPQVRFTGGGFSLAH